MTKKAAIESAPSSYVEHKGQMSLTFPTEVGVKALVAGNEIYQIWVEAPTIEELAVKYGYVLDNVVNK